MGGITDGNMQFVRGNDAERRVTELPPELMPDDGDFHRRGRFRSILNRVDHTRRSQKQNNDDQDRYDSPRQFDLGASIYLSRLAPSIRRSPAEFHDDIQQQTEHDQENERGDSQNKQ